jgi:nucleotide-binding universal stress UspA family protein
MPVVIRVIAGTSGSPGSLAALRHAEALARAMDAALVPVLAWTPPGGEGPDLLRPAGYLAQQWHQMAVQRMREALVAVWGTVPDDPRIQPQVRRGPPGWVLVSTASSPGDVLVVGTGGRGVLHRVAGRWVSRYCAARARCPVILVPPPELACPTELRRIAWRLTHRTLTPERILRDWGPASGIPGSAAGP